MGNQFGDLFRVSTFGESHGPALGVVIDGCPSGVIIDLEQLHLDLSRRRPGQSNIVTGREEADMPKILSGVYQEKSLGTPICIIVENKDQRSEDYDHIKTHPRRGHADDVWVSKFGHVDHRGGGRSSGRETVARVLAGSIAKMFIKQVLPATEVICFTQQIGPIQSNLKNLNELTSNQVYQSKVRMPDMDSSLTAEKLLLQAKEEGESFGGIAKVIVRSLPVGLGEPVFDKFKATLGSAFLSIGAVNGFEFGSGFSSIESLGTEFHSGEELNYGGVRGGITTGELVEAQVSFKPTSSVMEVAKKGRHDPCIVPRAISVLEAMSYLVIADFYLKSQLNRI